MKLLAGFTIGGEENVFVNTAAVMILEANCQLGNPGNRSSRFYGTRGDCKASAELPQTQGPHSE